MVFDFFNHHFLSNSTGPILKKQLTNYYQLYSKYSLVLTKKNSHFELEHPVAALLYLCNGHSILEYGGWKRYIFHAISIMCIVIMYRPQLEIISHLLTLHKAAGIGEIFFLFNK